MNKEKIFGELFYEWLSQFASAYRGVLPAGQKPNDLYVQFNGYYENFASQFVQPVSIYNIGTTSYTKVLEVAGAIENAVTEGGLLLKKDDLRVKIDKGSPFYQDKPDEDATVRAGYINLLVTIYGN